MSLTSNKRKRSSLDSASGDRAFDHPSIPRHSQPADREGVHIASERPSKKAVTRNAHPPPSTCLPIVLGGLHWHGLQSLQNIVIFGDSYSRFSDGKTWVDHFHRRIPTQSSILELYNYAFPGATAEEDLSAQLASFLEHFSKKDCSCEKHALDQNGTTYFVFLGINDCGSTDSDELEAVIEKIFDTLHELYVKAGARNFILFDVPPVDRSPQAIESDDVEEIANRVENWNELLRVQVADFGSSNDAATVLLFSSFQVLTDVLDGPLEYDLGEDDPVTEGGGIWVDDLHLTSEVQDILGERLFKALLGP